MRLHRPWPGLSPARPGARLRGGKNGRMAVSPHALRARALVPSFSVVADGADRILRTVQPRSFERWRANKGLGASSDSSQTKPSHIEPRSMQLHGARSLTRRSPTEDDAFDKTEVHGREIERRTGAPCETRLAVRGMSAFGHYLLACRSRVGVCQSGTIGQGPLHV
jgi:hypothetical protein